MSNSTVLRNVSLEQSPGHVSFKHAVMVRYFEDNIHVSTEDNPMCSILWVQAWLGGHGQWKIFLTFPCPDVYYGSESGYLPKSYYLLCVPRVFFSCKFRPVVQNWSRCLAKTQTDRQTDVYLLSDNVILTLSVRFIDLFYYVLLSSIKLLLGN